MNFAHYKDIRIAVQDYKSRINREKLDALSKRATPKQWSMYSTASLVIKTLWDKKPTNLYENLIETLYTERRHPHLGKFFNNFRAR